MKKSLELPYYPQLLETVKDANCLIADGVKRGVSLYGDSYRFPRPFRLRAEIGVSQQTPKQVRDLRDFRGRHRETDEAELIRHGQPLPEVVDIDSDENRVALLREQAGYRLVLDNRIGA